MKGVTIMTEEKSGRRIAQLDLTVLSKQIETLQDVLDVLIAEARKSEKDTAWGMIKKDLKKRGKL